MVSATKKELLHSSDAPLCSIVCHKKGKHFICSHVFSSMQLLILKTKPNVKQHTIYGQ